MFQYFDIFSLKERPSMQIYKPGMGRRNHPTNTKASNAKDEDEDKYKVSEHDDKNNDGKQFKQDKNTGRQRDRNNRNYKGETNERYENKRSDRDNRNRGQGKEEKDYDKYKSEDNRKRPEGKPDHRNRPKDDLDSVRDSDAQKNSAKHEGKSYNRDRRNVGRNNNEGPSNDIHSSKEVKEPSDRNENSDKKDLVKLNPNAPSFSMSGDSTLTSTDPPKEKERSGKSYRSKRKEREQQRGEQ